MTSLSDTTITIGPTHCTLDAVREELQLVQTGLTFPDDSAEEDDVYQCMVNDDGLFLTGLLPYVEDILKRHEIGYRLIGTNFRAEGKDVPVVPEDLLPGITLYDYQMMGVQKIIYGMRGIIAIAGGGGKTIMAIATHEMLRRENYAHRTLFVINTQPLAVQTRTNFESFGFETGLVGAGSSDTGCEVTVGLVQTLYRGIAAQRPDILALLSSVDLIVFDEAHHLPSDTWSAVGRHSSAAYRMALTATPYERSMRPETYRDYLLMGVTGPVLMLMMPQELVSRGILAQPIVMMINHGAPGLNGLFPNQYNRLQIWAQVYKKGIVFCNERNNYATRIAWSLYQTGFKSMILVHQVNHGKEILFRLHDLGYDKPIFSYGGNRYFTTNARGKIEVMNWTTAEVLDYLNEEESYIFVGSSVYDQGVDVPDLNGLIVLSGRKKLRPTLQRAYRAMRAKKSKIGNTAMIFDFIDGHHVYLNKHSNDRRAIYHDVGFEVHEDGLAKLADLLSEEGIAACASGAPDDVVRVGQVHLAAPMRADRTEGGIGIGVKSKSRNSPLEWK